MISLCKWSTVEHNGYTVTNRLENTVKKNTVYIYGLENTVYISKLGLENLVPLNWKSETVAGTELPQNAEVGTNGAVTVFGMYDGGWERSVTTTFELSKHASVLGMSWFTHLFAGSLCIC